MPNSTKVLQIGVTERVGFPLAHKAVGPQPDFFMAVSFEFDSRRRPMRDRIAEIMREWIGVLVRASELA